jgi:formylglycine-generating enzyme required for sulfatase activity
MAVWLLALLASALPAQEPPRTAVPVTPVEVQPTPPAVVVPATAQVRSLAPGTVFRDCDDLSCPKMVVIPAGSFQMGSPPSDKDGRDDQLPVHKVKIGYSFAVGKYPVTRGEWRQYLKASGHSGSNNCSSFNGVGWLREAEYTWSNPGFPQEDIHPVVCISWEEATDYAEWLAQTTGHHYRLLSEA